MTKDNKKLVRISELVKKSGVSAPTIKHYVKEGLLPQPVRPSKNMAYYEESCIKRIKLIKKIQKEKFLPLDVIKRIIDSGESYDSNVEMGQAIIKSHKLPVHSKKIKESKIESHTGLAIEKIQVLENEGLIHPELENGTKTYDESDCQIIEILKQREEIGVRFDYSIELLRIYRDSVADAVSKDVSMFARTMFGDIPEKKAIKLLTEADQTLDQFMVVYRYKMLRKFGSEAIREVNELAESMKLLIVFPVSCKELPEKPPQNQMEKCFYYLCKGDYKAVQNAAGNKNRKHIDYDIINFAILADILNGDLKKARSKVEKYIPKPSAYALNNAVAALTYLFSINDESGFSVPMFNTKKVLAYLKRIEKSNERHVFSRDLALYICGAVYVLLPDAVKQYHEGVEILSDLSWPNARKRLEENNYPDWIIRTLDYEILPAMEIRINRFLAEGYRKLGLDGRALDYLDELLAVSDPEDEISEWAGMQRLMIPK